jgi:3D (Asp-Asp-Asp) domain-containing protein
VFAEKLRYKIPKQLIVAAVACVLPKLMAIVFLFTIEPSDMPRNALPIADENNVFIQSTERQKNQTFIATAYTHAPAGGDINGTGDGLTAIGIPVREGIVAVDPSVIPLGSKIYVEGYGEALAADTGGVIKGNRIDVFFDCREKALQWGRRTVQVRIISCPS